MLVLFHMSTKDIPPVLNTTVCFSRAKPDSTKDIPPVLNTVATSVAGLLHMS